MSTGDKRTLRRLPSSWLTAGFYILFTCLQTWNILREIFENSRGQIGRGSRMNGGSERRGGCRRVQSRIKLVPLVKI